jgi:hypothetical protein
MIPYINGRCNEWVAWIRRRDDGGLGYPKECCYTRLQGRGPLTGYLPSVDDAAWEIDRAVRSLDYILHEALMAFYFARGTGDQKARDCRCGKTAFYERVHCAHQKIQAWLDDEMIKVERDRHFSLA